MTEVYLALYTGGGGIGNAAVRLWTRSPYSHCEIVIDGWCYSASVMDKGVRRKPVGSDAGEISLGEHWDLVPLPWADAAQVLAYFTATDHHKYGWPSLILSQLFNRGQSVDGVQFCSEWCAAALGLPVPASYSPASLASIAEWLRTRDPTPGGSCAERYLPQRV